MRPAPLYGGKHRGFGRKMLTTNPFDDDKLREECGIFGIWGADSASSFVALGIHALQHRGQEAAGIVSFDGTNYHAHRAMGHVAGNFDRDDIIRKLSGNVADEYALLVAGEEIPFELRARARRDQVRATGRAIASIDRLFEASGATALSNDAPVQRFWRDAHAGRVHAANDPERAYLIFGNNEFGLPPADTMV